jgi:hypothetical protein
MLQKIIEIVARTNFYVYLCTRLTANGTLADRLGNGLQNRAEQFDSARYLRVKSQVLNLQGLAIFIY